MEKEVFSVVFFSEQREACVFCKYIFNLGGAGAGEVDAGAPKLGVLPQKAIKLLTGGPDLTTPLYPRAGQAPSRGMEWNYCRHRQPGMLLGEDLPSYLLPAR